MGTTSKDLKLGNVASDYPLGYTNPEHDRLIRQAASLLSPSDSSTKQALVPASESWISARRRG